MRYYSDLLPSYLDGENIRRHSSVIERSDRYLDGLVELFGLWDKLERPILIKREQNSWDDGVNTVTLYVNTPTPITEIIIEGDIEETITPEDTVTTSYTNTWTIQNPSIEILTIPPPDDTSIRMPLLTVTVRTETHTYTKAYPENDTIQNNDADHDIFLDIVGGLLGIPRRLYTETLLFVPRYFMYTQPPYMAKQVDETDDNIIILPCSEDDYYYKERLEYFISTTDNLRLFRTVYDKDVTILRKEDNIIPSELVGTDSTILFTHIQKGVLGTLNNLNIDTTNIQEIAEQSLPITRPIQIYPYATIIKYNSTTQEVYVNRYKLHLTLGLNAKTIDQESVTMEVPIANLPVNITYKDGTEVGTFTTDETGTAHISIDGARCGQQTLKWNLTREYPYFSVITGGNRNIQYNASLFKLSLDDDAWQYKELSGTTVTNLETPTILDNDDLNCGTGILTYTPAINPQLVDLTAYTITVTFHYTGIGQSILLGTLQETETNTATINGIRTQPREHTNTNPDITDTHTLTYKFLNNICYIYYDGTYTGQHYDFTDTTDLIYLAGYNYYTDSENTGTQITNVTVTPTVDINTPPEYNGENIIDLQTTTTKIILRTDKPTARDPTRTQDGYDVGNWHVPHFTSLYFDENTRNTTVTVIFNTTRTSDWRMGFGKDNGTGTGWGRTYFVSTHATYTPGEHEIKFICDNEGTWTALFDGESCNMPPFVLDTRKNFACYVSYDTGQIFIKSISVGGNNILTTSLSVETISAMEGSAEIQATLTAGGSGINNAIITCKNGTSTVTSATTDSNGVCTLDLSSLQAGSYTLTVEYDGDSTYRSTSTTHNITITNTPVLNLYGKGQTVGWSTTQWTTIEINAAAEAHCNYTKRNAILKQLPLSGDFTLILHIQASHNQSWNWGLIPSQSDYSNPAMKVSKGDTLNTNTSIATMFDHGSGVWDTTVPVTVTRSGTTYTLEYNGNSYSFTGSTDTLYFWMDKTGNGNMFLTYIETTATMQ